MTAAEAIEIADETVRHWQAQGLTASEAMRALTGRRQRYQSWRDCTGFIMRWELRRAADRPARHRSHVPHR